MRNEVNSAAEHHLDSDSEEIPDAEVNAAMRSKVKKLPEAWLDVTIPLRFQVKDSKLEFHKVQLTTCVPRLAFLFTQYHKWL